MWWGVIGLLLDIVGVVVIGIPATRFVSSPVIGRVGNSKKLKEAKQYLYSEDRIDDNSDYFNILLKILRENYGELDVEQSPNEITAGNRFGIGNVVAVVHKTNGDEKEENRAIIGPLTLVDTWIETKIEQAYLRWGLGFVSLGFALQIVNMTL